MRALITLVLVLLLAAASCGGGDREEILVSAAASLTDVMDRLAQEYGRREPVDVQINLGGSTELAQQIVRGAPVDAFLSAGPTPMDVLEDRGLLASATRVDLLTNELVLAGRSEDAAELGISTVQDLAGSGATVAIADPDLAPAGRYAREALQSLGLWEQVEPRLVFGLNVRFALGFVEAGTAEVAIVYHTDVSLTDDLEVIAPIPTDSHSLILYPAAVVASSSHLEAARKFLEYLRGDEAGDIFREFGFAPAEG